MEHIAFMFRVEEPAKQETNMKFTYCLLHAAFLLFAYFSTLRMKAVCSFKTSVDFYRITQRYVQNVELFIATAVRTPNSTYGIL
jgi:hypothetical protein